MSRSCGALDHLPTQTPIIKPYFSVEELHLNQIPQYKRPYSFEKFRPAAEIQPERIEENPSEDLLKSEEVFANFESRVSVVEYEEVAVDDFPPNAARKKPPVPPKPLPLPLLKSTGMRPVSTGTSGSNSSLDVPKISKSLIYRPVKKVQSVKMASLEILVEEKLCSDGIDLTEEPYSDKVILFFWFLFF